MTLFLDPVASLKQDTLVFRAQARHENEIAPHLGRLLPTGGYLFSEQVQERLAQITGLTFAKLLPTGSAPPRIDVTTDRQITLRTQHANPGDAARHLPQSYGAVVTQVRSKRNRSDSLRSV